METNEPRDPQQVTEQTDTCENDGCGTSHLTAEQLATAEAYRNPEKVQYTEILQDWINKEFMENEKCSGIFAPDILEKIKSFPISIESKLAIAMATGQWLERTFGESSSPMARLARMFGQIR